MSNEDHEMLGLFVQEANEHLETLDSDLVALESNPSDSERLNRIFRAVHSIKGTAGFFGFSAIVELAHVMESVMALVREGKMLASPPMISLLLTSTDKLRLMVDDPDNASHVPSDAEKNGLEAMLHEEPAELSESEAPRLPAYLIGFTIDPALVREGLRHGQNFFVLQLRLQSDIEDQGQTLLDYFQEVASVGTLIATVTDIESLGDLEEEVMPALICSAFFVTAMEDTLLLGAFGLPASQLTKVPNSLLSEWVRSQPTVIPSAQVESVKTAETPVEPEVLVKDPLVSPVKVEPDIVDTALKTIVPALVAKPLPKNNTLAEVQPTAATPIASTRVKAEETVRINVSLLDALMNLAGEMVLGRNQLVRIAESASSQGGISGLHTVVQEISSITSEVQRTVMSARLQPVGSLFSKFTRIVRDLGQKLNKEIKLELHGEDVELDRTLLEGLSDPLTHLVRNSADHGIELPEERQHAGKPSFGRIRLAAAHLSGRVQIEVRDDGHGLNPEKLKTKALEKGIITPETAARMSDAEAHQLIFAAGFSTAEALSDISGRGVGMDVVKTNIEKLGGRVEIESEFGRGTAVIIRLPLTLAIIPALVIAQNGGGRFAVPQINLEEIVAIGPECPLENLGGAHLIRLREELLPVIILSDILQQAPTEEPPKRSYVLVLQLDHSRYGLLVDEISNTEEIVVKPLGRHLKSATYYSGATLLGQGEIALILDPVTLAAGRLPTDLMENQKVKALVASSTPENTERVLIFRDASPERFALHLSNITRVELIPSSRIERIGSRECLRQTNGPTLQIIRAGNHLPTAAPGEYPEEVYIIVPRLVHHPIGILATEILDATDLYPEYLDKEMFPSPALLGSCTLLERLTLVIDIYGLLNLAGFTHKETEEEQKPFSKLKILLAEDTVFFREAILRALKGTVAELDAAPDGEEAWKMLQTKTYDVLITDIEMPKLDGFGLTERIRNSPLLSKLPIIALSARGSEAFRSRAAQAGVNIYETKLDRERILTALGVLFPSKKL